MAGAGHAPGQAGAPVRSPRRFVMVLLWIGLASLVAGLLAYRVQAEQNRMDADERFALLSQRVTHGIVERLRRYEYGLRGARGVAAATDGVLTQQAFARYGASRQIDREFPGARGFGIVYRVSPADEAAFVKARRDDDSPGFSIRTLTPHEGDRFIITYVEPLERNREAIGLDIASESARRDAALRSAATAEATMTAPITLIQASGRTSGGLLLLLPIRRAAAGGAPGELIGWSYAPLLIEDILQGLDAEDDHFALSLFDLAQGPDTEFYATGKASALAAGLEVQRVDIPLYGRRWEAQLRPTAAFVHSLHQASPWSEAIKAMLLGGVFAALVATAAQLVDRTRGQRLELARRAAIVEGSDDAIIVQDFDGTITDWNDGATRLFGFSREEAVGRTATQLLLPPALAAEDETLRATVADGNRVHVFDTSRRARDGSEIAVSITASPIHDGDGAVVGSAKILRDVREAKAAAQRLQELNASLEDQVRDRTALLDEAMREAREANEAKSRFLTNVSHEIRTPMNAVIGLSHLLGRTRLDDDQAATLARILAAGKALMSLLNDVLDLSKIEAGEMTVEVAPFQFEDMLDEVASIVGVSAAQRGVSFSVSTHGALPGLVMGDSLRLAQILLNLLSNAVKFTPQGSVALDVQLGVVDQAGLLPVCLRVSDTGIGIPEDVQRRLFQPFVQADASTTRRFGGTGLGLSIVRQLVELLGGTITLASEPGRGSSFQVDLSLQIAGQEAMPVSAARRAEGPGQLLAGVTVLVVDDNALNREVADRILRSEGAIVAVASDGEQAVALLGSGASGFQAVLMDVQMPVMDGLEATRRIRALPGDGRVPIVGLTAGVSSDERRLALDAGMDAVVGKPFDPAVLATTISRLLGRPVDPAPVAGPAPRPAAPPAGWPVIDGLDAQQSFSNLKGDGELFGRMLAALADMIGANGRVLAGDEPPAQRLQGHAALLHDLKAMAATVGAADLQAAAGRAEQALRAGRWHDALADMACVADLGRPISKACTAIAAMPAASRGDVPADRLDGERLSAFIGQLRRKDLAALPAWQALEAAFGATLGDVAAQRVARLVQALDFESAEQAVCTACAQAGIATP
ncbi:CHASE domain-containing protein [Roseateles sp.]|uniref:CHASE domain-containing protein n=1 Tax=Roseateles sp. TaxID=1971397 RepID=UPI003BA8B92F